MKIRRILTIVLSLVMVLSIITPAQADGTETHCICGAPGGVHLQGCDGTEQTWTAVTSLPSSAGYYYLNADISVSARTALSGDICLDLHGHTVTSTVADHGVFSAINASHNCSLTLLDTVGGGKIDMNAAVSRAGLLHVANSGTMTLNIYGGVYDASGAETTGTTTGASALIRSAGGTCTINICGGTLICGEGKANSQTGGIYLASGSTLNMYGGVIRDGKASHSGANVYAAAGSVFNMYGGEISGGSVTNSAGGNIIVTGTGASMTMSGGSVCGGSANAGGNIAVTLGGSLTMTGGSISEGVANSGNGKGGNIYNSGGTLTVSGTARIFDGEGISDANGDGNVYTNSGTTNIADGCAYFSSSDRCICGASVTGGSHLPGCDGTVYSDWVAATSLPNTTGRYYLDADVTVGTTINLNAGQKIVLDLNGHTVTSTCTNRLFIINNTNVELTILDSAGGGTIILGGTSGGALAHMVNPGDKVLTVYGGTIDASGVTVSANRGGAIVSTKDNKGTATINIHGGTLIGGKANTSYNGGAISLEDTVAAASSTLNMTGGTITGGETGKHGGNIYLGSRATMNMSGGLITGGEAGKNNPSGAVGGNILVQGATFVMTGGEISEGRAPSGGNIGVAVNPDAGNQAATVTISGGSIYNGDAYLNGTEGGRGGNIYNSGCDVTISDSARVYDGLSDYLGNNICDNNATTVGADDPDLVFFSGGFSAALVLADSIGIRFAVNGLSAKRAGNYSVTYSYKDETNTVACTAENNTFDIAQCTAVEMTEPVEITVNYSNANGTNVEKVFTTGDSGFTVKDYCDAQLRTAGISSELGDLCTAVLTYGEAAQKYFNKSGELPTSTNPAADLSGLSAPGTDKNVFATSGSVSGITASATLALTSVPTLVFKVKGSELDTVSVSVASGADAVAITPVISGEEMRIEITGIYPTLFDKEFTLTIAGGSETRTISYSALSYICRKWDTSNADLKYVCQALYNYYLTATAYEASVSAQP